MVGLVKSTMLHGNQDLGPSRSPEACFRLQGQQWVRMVVLGQSFMLHQIRKLVGTAVAVMRGDAPPECIPLALKQERSVVTPMAPELGLFLDECVFESYNDKWGNDREARVALSDFQEQADAVKVNPGSAMWR